MTIRAVVFDLFHTLVDPEDFRPRDFLRVERAAALLGLEAADVAEHWVRGALALNRCVDSLAEVAAARGIAIGAEALEEADRALGCWQDRALLEPRPEVPVALRALRDRGLRLGVLSDANERDVRAWASSCFPDLLDAVSFSFETGLLKNDPRAFDAVLRRLGVRAAEAAFVGDGGSDELAGAREAGFGLVVWMAGHVRSNGLRTGQQLAHFASSADAVVESVGDVAAMLESRR